MKISLQWLNDFVDIKEYLERPDQLANLLTTTGLEVEEIHSLLQQYKFVKTALILEKDKHPDADKLSLCKVTTGEGVIHQIVCGAKNHKAQDKVILALPGAILPGNMTIKNSVIRGVASEGMLCSYKELGLADTSDGIAILPESTSVGIPFADYAGLNDVTLELKVTPNRADCLSHLGLAREVSCLLNRPFKKPSLKELPPSNAPIDFQVQVLNPEMCPRYTGRIIRNVKVGPSPSWLKKRLESVGLNSINNVVDVTNYVMMEWGQPLHAFDLRHIQGGIIRVGKATPQEKFMTLDGTELTLRGDELMIQDSHRSLCMAGVIGGKNSGVQEDTQDIFLESAFFAPQFARRSARNHGLSTDSGYRFSRGVDPNATLEALERATQLIHECAGGLIGSKTFEVKSHEISPVVIPIDPEIISQRLGYSVDVPKFESWMIRLGCQVEKTETIYKIKPPSWRFDIEMDMDLVEEYARLNGYDHIPETLPPLNKVPTKHDTHYSFQSRLVDIMTSLGYCQALNFAFVSEKKQTQFIGHRDLFTKTGLSLSSQPVKLVNPLNEQLNIMRSTLSLGLLDNLHHNVHHSIDAGRLFEIGSVFEHNPNNSAYIEKTRWAGVAWGWPINLWTKDLKVPVVMDLKQSIETTLRSFGFKDWQWHNSQEIGGLPHFLHPGQSVVLQLDGKNLGFLGTLHPSLKETMKIRWDAALFEFDTSSLLQTNSISSKMTPISKFQAVDRDLSLLMPQELGAGLVQSQIQQSGGPHLKTVIPIDLYLGENLENGQKSITYRLCFQSLEGTLTDDQIQKIMDNILLNIKKHWEIQVR